MERRRIVLNKKTVIFILLFLVLLCLAAFFGVRYIRQQTGAKVMTEQAYAVNSAQEFANSIMDKLGFTDMTLLSSQQTGNYYALPLPLLQSSAVYTSHSDSALQEIAVFQFPTEQDHALIARAVDDRVKTYIAAQNSLNNSELTDDLYFLETTNEFVILVLGAPYEQVSTALQNLAAENTTQKTKAGGN